VLLGCDHHLHNAPGVKGVAQVIGMRVTSTAAAAYCQLQQGLQARSADVSWALYQLLMSHFQQMDQNVTLGKVHGNIRVT
jgi:hypothetical protein